MATASSPQASDECQALSLDLFDHLPESVTLLELVYAISAISSDEEVVVDTAITLLARGRVQLRGNFRGSRAEDLIV